MWLDPVPIEEDIHLAYQRYYTHSQSHPHGVRALYATLSDIYVRQRLGYPAKASLGIRMVARAFALLHPGGGAELARKALFLNQPDDDLLLLDVGCGSGEFLAYMRGLGWRVEGVEVDPMAVESARSLGLSVREGELAAQNYPDRYADVVCLIHVIEHLHDPMSTLVESLRILKPNGRLVIATPNGASLGHLWFKSNWWALDPPRHLMIFNPPSLRRLASSAGLEIQWLVSTARRARNAWTLGRRLSYSATWDMSRPPALISSIVAIPFQLWERLLIRAGREVGEELFMIARPRNKATVPTKGHI
jgi:SAM-dependent methyltransferase